MSSESEQQEENKNNSNNDLMDGCSGCGCVIVILWIIIAAVSWAWHIHWFFGILMFFFMLAIFH